MNFQNDRNAGKKSSKSNHESKSQKRSKKHGNESSKAKRSKEDEENYGRTVAAFLRRVDAKKARQAKMEFEKIMYQIEFGNDEK